MLSRKNRELHDNVRQNPVVLEKMFHPQNLSQSPKGGIDLGNMFLEELQEVQARYHLMTGDCGTAARATFKGGHNMMPETKSKPHTHFLLPFIPACSPSRLLPCMPTARADLHLGSCQSAAKFCSISWLGARGGLRFGYDFVVLGLLKCAGSQCAYEASHVQTNFPHGNGQRWAAKASGRYVVPIFPMSSK